MNTEKCTKNTRKDVPGTWTINVNGCKWYFGILHPFYKAMLDNYGSYVCEDFYEFEKLTRHGYDQELIDAEWEAYIEELEKINKEPDSNDNF